MRASMTLPVNGRLPVLTHGRDVRALALAIFPAPAAADFSMSADVNNSGATADAGMALLDAASWPRSSASRSAARGDVAGRLFESAPTVRRASWRLAEIDRALRRPLAGSARSSANILRDIHAALETS